MFLLAVVICSIDIFHITHLQFWLYVLGVTVDSCQITHDFIWQRGKRNCHTLDGVLQV